MCVFMCANVHGFVIYIASPKTDPDQKESEHPDSDLIWNLQLMAQVTLHDAINDMIRTV